MDSYGINVWNFFQILAFRFQVGSIWLDSSSTLAVKHSTQLQLQLNISHISHRSTAQQPASHFIVCKDSWLLPTVQRLYTLPSHTNIEAICGYHSADQVLSLMANTLQNNWSFKSCQSRQFYQVSLTYMDDFRPSTFISTKVHYPFNRIKCR